MKDNDLERILKRVSKRGISKDCQKIIPKIAMQYFGIPIKGPYMKSKFVDKIYHRLESVLNEIKINTLKIISSELGDHNKKNLEGYLFTESVLKYLFMHDKDKELFNRLKDTLNENDKLALTRRYGDNQEKNDVKPILDKLSKNLKLYSFVMDNIINSKYNSEKE